jgi:hypothetical protein
MTDLYPSPEGFFVTTLASDLTATSSVISLTALPVRITKGYMVIEPSSATKREVIHFTSVGVSSVTCADDTTDATDATGRGCLGSVALGGVTTHDQGVTVIISAVEQYWARAYAAFTADHSIAGAHKSGTVLTLPQINDTSSDHQYIFAVSELAADRTVTLPLLTGNDTFVFADFIQTLANKTLNTPVLNKPVVNGTNPTGATYTPATGSQTVALDCALNNLHIVTGHADGTAITFTVANATNNQPFIVSILQGSGTVSTIAAWFSTVRWAGGSAPTLTATLNKRDTFGFIRTGANTYDGFVIGQNA